MSTLYAVSRGNSYVTPGLVARLLTLLKQPTPRPAPNPNLADLKEREMRILDHVARGLTNKEIANRLSISEKTVKHYMTIIMQKLHARNRMEAVLVLQKNTTRQGPNPMDGPPHI